MDLESLEKLQRRRVKETLFATPGAENAAANPPFAGDELEKGILRFLSSRGICPKCCLRFYSCSYIEAYSESFPCLAQIFRDRTAEVLGSELAFDADPAQCPACCGLMALVSGEAFHAELSRQVLEEGYELRSFILGISIGPAIAALEKLVQLDAPVSDCFDLKTAAKYVLGPVTRRLLGGVPVDRESDLQIAVSFDADVQLRLPPTLRPRRRRWAPKGAAPAKRGTQLQMHDENFVGRFRGFLRTTTVEKLTRMGLAYPAGPFTGALRYEVLPERMPQYLVGRYLKHTRGISQTAWPHSPSDGSDVLTCPFITSLEELVCPAARAAVRAENAIFHASGREDIDVRMLGSGRPFAIELIRARLLAVDCKAVEAEINAGARGLVEVHGLRRADRDIIKALSAAGTDKRKRYRLVCFFSEAAPAGAAERLSAMTDVELTQRTPVRVLHRRPLLPRRRTVHSISARALTPRCFVLEVETQAGTYVKEFVHGDLGRTSPSVAELVFGADTAAHAQILQLDVTEIVTRIPGEGA